MIWTVFSGKQALGIVNEHTREQAQAAAEERYGWTRDLSGRLQRRPVRVGHFKKIQNLVPPPDENLH